MQLIDIFEILHSPKKDTTTTKYYGPLNSPEQVKCKHLPDFDMG